MTTVVLYVIVITAFAVGLGLRWHHVIWTLRKTTFLAVTSAIGIVLAWVCWRI